VVLGTKSLPLSTTEVPTGPEVGTSERLAEVTVKGAETTSVATKETST
jgi:hypothetical protein